MVRLSGPWVLQFYSILHYLPYWILHVFVMFKLRIVTSMLTIVASILDTAFNIVFLTTLSIIQHNISFGGGQNEAVQVPSPMTTIGSKASYSPSHVEEKEVKIDFLKKILDIAYEDKGGEEDRHVKIMLDHDKTVCFVSFKEISDMVSGKEWLELGHLSIWCT